MKRSYRVILEVLSRRRKPITTSSLSKLADMHPSGIYRALNELEHDKMLTRKKDGRTKYILITKHGRDWLKINPALDDGLPVHKSRGVNFSETQRLWYGCGLKNITISVDYACFDTAKGDSIKYDSEIRSFNSFDKATAHVARRRGKTNVFFTPAATEIVKIKFKDRVRKKKKFIYSQVLWLDYDIRSKEKAFLSREERLAKVSVVLQEIINDGIPVFALVDSGNGFHIYFRVRNKITDEERLERALKGLSKRYGGDIKTTKATAFLRVPGTTNIKEISSGKNSRKPCELIQLIKGNFCRLADIEKVLGYDVRNERAILWRQQRHGDEVFEGDDKDYMSFDDDLSFDDFDEDTSFDEFDDAVNAVKESDPKRKANIMRIIKNGYDEEFEEDMSYADFWLMCEAIRQGYFEEEIFEWFTDSENGICIFNRGKKNRDMRYLEMTYQKAEAAVNDEL